jgi:hypothetical protein
LANERPHLRIRRDIEFLAEHRLVQTRVLHRSGAIAGPCQRAHEPERYPRAVRIARGKSPPPWGGADEVCGCFSLVRQLFERSRVASCESLALGLDPAVELGSAADVKALEELAAIELDRITQPAAVERFLEANSVAPEICPVYAQRVAIPAHKRACAESLTEHVDGLAQRVAGMLLVVLGPEQRNERVAPMKGARRCEREVGE